MDARRLVDRDKNMHLAHARSRVALRSEVDLFRRSGAGEKTRGKDGFSSRRYLDPDPRRLRCMQRFTVRRLLSRSAADAFTLRSRRRIGSGGGRKVFEAIG